MKIFLLIFWLKAICLRAESSIYGCVSYALSVFGGNSIKLKHFPCQIFWLLEWVSLKLWLLLNGFWIRSLDRSMMKFEKGVNAVCYIEIEMIFLSHCISYWKALPDINGKMKVFTRFHNKFAIFITTMRVFSFLSAYSTVYVEVFAICRINSFT